MTDRTGMINIHADIKVLERQIILLEKCLQGNHEYNTVFEFRNEIGMTTKCFRECRNCGKRLPAVQKDGDIRTFFNRRK